MTMDDPFLEIVSGIEIEFPNDVVDVTKLTTEELLNLYNDYNDKLFELSQALNPNSQEARDLHSLRNSIQIEIRKRGK